MDCGAQFVKTERRLREQLNSLTHDSPGFIMVLKTTITLSESISKTLKMYTIQTKNSMHAQSKVVEEALLDYFERRQVSIEQ